MLSEIFKDLLIAPYKRGRFFRIYTTFKAAITLGYEFYRRSAGGEEFQRAGTKKNV